MSSDRDQLAALIDPGAWAAPGEDQRTLGGQWDFKMRRFDSEQAAQRAGNAGWRPPAQVIETPEALAALPVGTVIRDANGEFHRLDPYGIGEGTWYPAWLTGNAYAQDFGQTPRLDAEVVWSPTEKVDTE